MKGKRDEMNVDQGKSWKENRIEEEAKIKIGNEEEKWISGERQRMRIEKNRSENRKRENFRKIQNAKN